LCLPLKIAVAVAAAREKSKENKYKKDAAAMGFLFKPLVFETYGYVTKNCMDPIKKLAELIAERSNSHNSLVVLIHTVGSKIMKSDT